ncbi:MAG TPA: PAS domain-containing protein, partial [Polyangia bacterium]
MIDEQQRLDELRRYDVLDTEREPAFDRLVELAALACGTPIAYISLVDETRVWHKAEHGAAVGETRREGSFCVEAVRAGRLHVVEDVAAGNGCRFYAGAPLVTPRGLVLGSLCVLDRQPRRFSDEARRTLELLRDQVMMLLEDRRELLELRRSEGLRQEAVEALVATKADLERRVELRTREAEGARQRVEQILARVADGFVALDRDWRYVYVNERAAAMFGRTPGELIGKHIWTEFPNGVGQPFHLAYERAMREQVPITLAEHYAPWDRWFENRIYPSPEGVTIFFTEMTEQRRAELALEETARRLNEAQAVAHVGSWQWSVAANRVDWSDEMFRI